MSHPPKSIIRPPNFRCASLSAVFFNWLICVSDNVCRTFWKSSRPLRKSQYWRGDQRDGKPNTRFTNSSTWAGLVIGDRGSGLAEEENPSIQGRIPLLKYAG